MGDTTHMMLCKEPNQPHRWATLIQIAAVPVVIAAPRVGVAIGLLCEAFVLPQPKGRYKPGEEPNEAEKLNE